MFFQVFIALMNFLIGKMAACANLEVVTLRDLHFQELVCYIFNSIRYQVWVLSQLKQTLTGEQEQANIGMRSHIKFKLWFLNNWISSYVWASSQYV